MIASPITRRARLVGIPIEFVALTVAGKRPSEIARSLRIRPSKVAQWRQRLGLEVTAP